MIETGTVSSLSTYSMLLLSIVVIIGLLETSDAFHSFAPIQRTFHGHPTPQMWNHTQVYGYLCIPLENNKGYFLGSRQTTTGEGKPSKTFIPAFCFCSFQRVRFRVQTCFTFYNLQLQHCIIKIMNEIRTRCKHAL